MDTIKKPKAVKPKEAKPKAVKPKEAKPKAVKPKEAKPKAAKPKAVKSKVIKDVKAAKPKEDKPKAVKSKVIKDVKADKPKKIISKEDKPKTGIKSDINESEKIDMKIIINDNNIKNTTCDRCEYDFSKSKYDPNRELYLCKECYYTKPSYLLTQTQAIDKYPVSRADISNIRSKLGGWKTMYYLFLEEDIKNVSILKHGSEEGYKHALKVRENRKIKRDARKKERDGENARKIRRRYEMMQEESESEESEESEELELYIAREPRRNELREYFESIGLELRDDSVLCNEYMDGSDYYTKEELGVIMKEMDFYYRKTSYNSFLNNIRSFEKSQMRGILRDFEWDEYQEKKIRDRSKKLAFEEYVKKNMQTIIKNDYKDLNVPESLIHKLKPMIIKMQKEEENIRRTLTLKK